MDYPEEWKDGTIPKRVKDEAEWRCISCEHPHCVKTWHVLTVHHLDGIKSNVEWWNPACRLLFNPTEQRRPFCQPREFGFLGTKK